jgi:hypothetical protein
LKVQKPYCNFTVNKEEMKLDESRILLIQVGVRWALSGVSKRMTQNTHKTLETMIKAEDNGSFRGSLKLFK